MKILLNNNKQQLVHICLSRTINKNTYKHVNSKGRNKRFPFHCTYFAEKISNMHDELWWWWLWKENYYYSNCFKRKYRLATPAVTIKKEEKKKFKVDKWYDICNKIFNKLITQVGTLCRVLHCNSYHTSALYYYNSYFGVRVCCFSKSFKLSVILFLECT